MPFWVKGENDAEDDLGAMYQDDRLALALSDWLRLVETDETATITWSI